MNVMRNPKRARPIRVPATAPTMEPADKPELGDAVETALIVVDGTSEIGLVNANVNGSLFTVAEKAVVGWGTEVVKGTVDVEGEVVLVDVVVEAAFEVDVRAEVEVEVESVDVTASEVVDLTGSEVLDGLDSVGELDGEGASGVELGVEEVDESVVVGLELDERGSRPSPAFRAKSTWRAILR